MQLIHAVVVLAGALGAGALPSVHQHNHLHNRLRHLKRTDGGRFVKAVHTDVQTVTETVYTNPPATPPPAPVAQAPAPAVQPPAQSPQVQPVVQVPPPQNGQPEPKPVAPAPALAPAPAPALAPAPAPALAPAPAPAPAPAAAPAAAAPAPKAAASPGTSGKFVPFCANSKRATAAQIASVGNIGSTYGCNMMSVDSDIADLYNYRMTFKNVDQSPYQLVCFNKIGRDGGVDGFFKGHGESVNVQVAPGESHVVAFQPDSLGSCAFGKGSIEISPIGQYLGTWGEFSFGDTNNGAWSGADCSSLAASVVPGAAISGCHMCLEGSNAKCSTILPNGTGDNAFTRGMEGVDGVGLNIPPTKDINIVVQMGYSG